MIFADLLELLTPGVALAFAPPTPRAPAPAPDPYIYEKAKQERDIRATAAQVEGATRGRGFTDVAGTAIALETQMKRGAANRTRRSAAAETMGL